MKRLQKAILIESFCLCLLGGAAAAQWEPRAVTAEEQKGDFIKWVDFNVSYEALCAAYQWDIDTHGSEHPVSWIELLAYLAARDGDNFGKSSLKRIAETAGQLAEGSVTMEELTRDLSHYSYYKEAYTAVLGGYVGEYEIETAPGSGIYEKRYGLKAYLPLAKGFPYGDYDDFGVSRSYGYRRQHLGHDMMGQIGTPVIAVESGYVEAAGWNQYGGWRLGIRSFDGQRYYYYAHLRQNYPYAEGLEEGSVVTAGDVIGYMGHTGYSTTENVNNIDEVHLHFGIQLIFDESQKEGNSEIWINPYQLVRFLRNNQSEAVKVENSREWIRSQNMKDPAATSWQKEKMQKNEEEKK
ncbi:MAG: M23 family metallopeptidase [Lachnospiraceae bacterium]|nr:M23 family metallopeptidase [Lachnospiraceae bacterium]